MLLGSAAGVAYVAGVVFLLFAADRDFPVWIVLAAGLTVPFYGLLLRQPPHRRHFYLGLALRIVALLALPRLSEDIYRFIWDGGLWWAGLHPLDATPVQLLSGSVEEAAFAKTHAGLLQLMNSPNYYTVYPPGSQLVFAAAGAFAGTPWLACLVLKLLLLAGDLAVYVGLRRLDVARRGLAELYWLHPLIIVELVGNAHFEGLAVACLVWALVSINKMASRSYSAPWAGTYLSMGVLVKLVPLLAAPAFALHLLLAPGRGAVRAGRHLATGAAWWQRLGLRGVLGFSGALLLTTVLGFLLFVAGADVTGFGGSLDLYFRHFEFNGSLYVLARQLGQWYKGYNWIATVGPVLGLAALLGIMLLAIIGSWRRWPLAQTLLWSFGLYLLCATTLHPWYFTYVVVLGILSGYRWPLLLGLTGFLSYMAYGQEPVEVPLWATLLEYLPVLGLAAYEMAQQKAETREVGDKALGKA